VGAAGNNAANHFCGAAYVFEDKGSGWGQVAELTAYDGVANNGFGSSVSISGQKAVVGAWADNTVDVSAGAVYVFEEGASGWTQIAKETASDGTIYGQLGMVAIDGDTVVAGAASQPWGLSYGEAYVFKESGRVSLTKDTGLDPTDRVTNDRTPVLSLTFTEPVYGQASEVTVTDPKGNSVTPDAISGWGTDTLTMTFSTPLTVDGQYTVSLRNAITDRAGNALNAGGSGQTHQSG